MNFLSGLKKCACKVAKKRGSLFTYDINKQKKYILNFQEPKDDIERSFYQYKCQMKLYGAFLSILINILSLFLIIVYFIKLLLNKSKCKAYHHVSAVFFHDGKPKNILPIELIEEYFDIVYEDEEIGYSLNPDDKKFLIKIVKRYPISWHFLFKCMMKIAKYSYAKDKYSPNAIVVCGEYSFTSSILTKYCEENNMEHINVMHGEKLFYMRDSFFHYHRFYIWDEYYKYLFIDLRADNKQFITSVPKSIKFSRDYSKKVYDYTYYLAAENEDELILISESLKKLDDKGYKIAIRPHPRYTDLKLITKLFSEYDIEDYNITIEESVLRTKNAISLYSTVLNQAYHNGVNIVIDDIANREKFEKLVDLQYMFLHKQNKLLSQEVS